MFISVRLLTRFGSETETGWETVLGWTVKVVPKFIDGSVSSTVGFLANPVESDNFWGCAKNTPDKSEFPWFDPPKLVVANELFVLTPLCLISAPYPVPKFELLILLGEAALKSKPPILLFWAYKLARLLPLFAGMTIGVVKGVSVFC